MKHEGERYGMNECPNCRGRLVGDFERGEVLCAKCGFVLHDQAVDQSAEWKSVNYEEGLKKIRVGLPNTNTLHDYGLSTDISSNQRDSHGRYLDATNWQRLKKLQRRVRTSSSGERSLSIALGKISEASVKLGLPAPVIEEASHIFRKSAKAAVSKSKSISGMAAASIYLACRRTSVNRSLKAIAVAAGAEDRAAAKYYRMLLSLEHDYIPPPSVQKYISKLVNMEKINPRVERLALELAEKTNESEISSGKTPAGLAAAYVYMASVLAGEHIPQKDIAEFAEVTEVTVRNRCREILESFVIRQKLRVSREALL